MKDKMGLSEAQAEQKLKSEGRNVFTVKKKKTLLEIFTEQFKDIIIIMLIIGAVVSLVLGETADGIVIMVIVLMNGTLGFIQEYRTEKSLEALMELSAPVCTVVRDGKKRNINAENLATEDVVLLGKGDRIPADCKIISDGEITVNESVLTGESVSVHKGKGDLLFMGTGICSGKCTAEVTATGMNTKMGGVAEMLQNEDGETPLKKRLNKVGKMLVGISLGVCVVIAFAGIYYGQSVSSVFFSGVSLAVAAIPEGLPAAVTLCLAIGVRKMLGRNAVIRKLPAVETLGCTTVICSDKTGTLTQNKMTAVSFYAEGTEKDNSEGNGNGFEILRLVGKLCLDAETDEKSGDPTERAIYSAAVTESDKTVGFERKGEVPFSSERKVMSVVYEKNGEYIIAVKGAPDRIINKCRYVYINGKEKELDNLTGMRIQEKIESMASRALRVIAFAYRREKSEIKACPEAEQNLVFAGLMGLTDPPRSEVPEAIRKCYMAGIRPIMITGDHRRTAISVAGQVGIKAEEENVMNGEEIDLLSDEELERKVGTVNIFARVGPEHKLRVVKALKKMGHIVAMTGDGVNDAPALKEADIGVAMGKTGTDVAKEAATVILTDDNFATIVSAVEEGRTIYSNIRKFIRYLLSCNLGEILLMGCAAFMGLPVPLLPIQILWVNLVTDGLPALALGMCKGEKRAMKSPPRNPGESFFAGGLGGNIVFSGLIIGSCALIAFVTGYRVFGDINTGRTACFAVIIISELFFALECRNEKEKTSVFSNIYLISAVGISFLLMIIVIYNPVASGIFHVIKPDGKMWGVIVLLSFFEPVLAKLTGGRRGKVIKAGRKA